MLHGPLWLVTVCLLPLMDLSLAITVNIGSFIFWAYCLGLYVTYGFVANNLALALASVSKHDSILSTETPT
jgi:hypothetical protein